MFHRIILHSTSKITPKYVYTMYIHQCNAGEENSKGILKTLSYIVSLNKNYFKAKDLTNMLGIKPKGRHIHADL